MQKSRVLVVIPVYNHPAHLRQVAEGAIKVHPHVLVVDDGSAEPVLPLLEGLNVAHLSHEANRGKGAAIHTGARYARDNGFDHIITIDADGQHDPEQIPRFVAMAQEHPTAIVVGFRNFDTANVPKSSVYGRSFSNFWLRVQTGRTLGDVQSGYRAYPVAVLLDIKHSETRFAFEVEVLVRSAWAGAQLLDLPIGVIYHPPGVRVTHFHKFWDNVRLSLLNTKLTMLSAMPWRTKRVERDKSGVARVSVLTPMKSIKALLTEDAEPGKLAMSVSLGLVLGAMPLIGFQVLTVLALAGYFKLNRVAALSACQVCMPPFVPALAIEAGHYVLKGTFLTEFSLKTLGYEAHLRLLDWFVGSLLVGPGLALIIAPPVYLAGVAILKGQR